MYQVVPLCCMAAAATENYTLSLHDALPILNPAWSPADTEAASAILAMDTSPQFTAMSAWAPPEDRKSTRLNSSHVKMSYAVLWVVEMTWTEAEAPAARVAEP